MENVLHKVNQQFIALKESDVKRNNEILQVVRLKIINEMKKADILFDTLFERLFYGGSFYDNLKVGKPEEYDLDIVLVLPKIISPVVIGSSVAGFVHVVANEFERLQKQDETKKYKGLDAIIVKQDNKTFFSASKVLQWMESLVTKALNTLQKSGNGKITTIDVNGEMLDIRAKCYKTGPAFTLNITAKSETQSVEICIDLVPSFQFQDTNWPPLQYGYRRNHSKKKKNYLTVPKMPKDVNNKDIFWRLSFQEQEREILSGGDLKRLKPVLKLIKLLRDFQNHKMTSSYFIKTLVLWEVETQNRNFWAKPLSVLFKEMLRIYGDALKIGTIKYYWNSDYNLIGHLKEATCKDLGNYIKNIITEIERPESDPFVVAKFLIPAESIDSLREEVDLGKKHSKKLNLSPLPIFNMKL